MVRPVHTNLHGVITNGKRLVQRTTVEASKQAVGRAVNRDGGREGER